MFIVLYCSLHSTLYAPHQLLPVKSFKTIPSKSIFSAISLLCCFNIQKEKHVQTIPIDIGQSTDSSAIRTPPSFSFLPYKIQNVAFATMQYKTLPTVLRSLVRVLLYARTIQENTFTNPLPMNHPLYKLYVVDFYQQLHSHF